MLTKNPSAVLRSHRSIAIGTVSLAAFLCLAGCETTTTEETQVTMPTGEMTGSILDSRLSNLRKEAEQYPKKHALHYEIAFESARCRVDPAIGQKVRAVVMTGRKACERGKRCRKFHYRSGIECGIGVMLGELTVRVERFHQNALIRKIEPARGESIFITFERLKRRQWLLLRLRGRRSRSLFRPPASRLANQDEEEQYA